MAETKAVEPQPAMTVVYDAKAAQEIQAAAPSILAQANEFTIESDDDYLATGSFLTSLVERKKKVEALFEKPVKDAHSVHRFLTALRGTLLSPYEQASQIIEKLRREYRRKEEVARLALEEEKRKEARQQVEALAMQEAAELASAGEEEAADIVLSRAAQAPIPTVVVPSTIPKQAGHTVRKFWAYRIVNEGLIKREFMEPDETKIRAIVSKMGKDAVTMIGGIQVYEDETETTRVKK